MQCQKEEKQSASNVRKTKEITVNLWNFLSNKPKINSDWSNLNLNSVEQPCLMDLACSNAKKKETFLLVKIQNEKQQSTLQAK